MSIASLYPSINPSLLLDFANSKVLDPRITFSRTTTATYYDGVTTAKAEENLLLYSQAFDDSSWSKTNSNITANSTTAPDGTTTADTLTPTANSGIHEMIPTSFTTTVNGSAYAISIFAKKDGGSFIQILVSNQSSDFANFDLNAGTVGTTGGSITAAIQNIGSGWYRCSMIFTAGGTDRQPRFDIVDSASASRRPTWTAAGTETVFLWGAQLEQRSSATAYTATTTQAITNYIPVLQTAASGVARFDHNPTTGESLGLLIEEARTNSLTYSSDFSNAAWVKFGNTITSNTIIAPDGTLTGDKVVPASSQTANQNYQNKTLSTGTNYAISCYAKKGEYSYLNLGFIYNTGNYAGAQFDLNAGSVLYTRAAASGYSVVSTSITPVGNGWYFCTVVATTGFADSYINVAASNSTWTSGWPDVAITGNGFSGIYIWGAQVEAGSFATSYIPTVASSVTRNADAASMTGTNFTSFFSNVPGSMYSEFSCSAFACPVGVYNTSVTITEGNRIEALANDSAGLIVGTGSGGNSGAGVSVTANTKTKFALSYATTGSALYKNGASASTLGAQAIGMNVNSLYLGSRAYGNGYLNGRLSKVAFYPLAMTNAQLQALTV